MNTRIKKEAEVPGGLCAEYASKIIEAYDYLKPVCTRTEIRHLDWLQKICGINAFGKFENQQRTGSFKFRGAYNRLRNQDTGKPVIAASAGNHGLAIADAARLLNVQATICIPTTASPIKKSRLAAYDHSIIQQGGSLEEATDYAKDLAKKRDWDFISPYNDPRIIQGQGTVAVEFLEQLKDIDTFIVPVGGGGLISGIGAVAKYLKPSIKIIGVEPEKYASLSSSMEAGAVKRVVHYPTFADGLAVNLEENSVTLEISRSVIDKMVLVTEEEIAAATLSLLYHESQLVEPSGAIVLAAIVAGKIDPATCGNVGLVFSGGNMSTASLSRIMNYPYEDKKLFGYINIYGSQLAHQTAFQGVDFSDRAKSGAVPLSLSDQEHDCTEDTEYWESRFEDAKRIVGQIGLKLSDYLDYCQSEHLIPDKAAVKLVQEMIAKAGQILDKRAVGGDSAMPPADYNRIITDNLQQYRSLLHMILAASMALDWRSASYNQSLDTCFFGIDTQENPGVNYNRYESNQLSVVEKMLAEIQGLNQRNTALFATSSGMASYNLIESYLTRYVLKQGDTVYIPHYIYFETDEQISKLPGITVYKTDTHAANEIIDTIIKKKPKVVFMDPMTNTVELRMTDVESIIASIAREKLEADIYFVIDGTMMSGELNVFPLAGDNPHVKVLYYDSCSKYLQLGLDIAMGGLVACPVEYGPTFDRLRRNTGTIMYDSAANIFPIYSRAVHQKRMRRFTRNAMLIGQNILADEKLTEHVEPHFPLLPNHPDKAVASRFNSLGGLITFTFKDPYLNQRDSLNSYIATALIVAKEKKVSLTKGVSFGFSIPRISAASSIAETTAPFLRLSVGDRSYAETSLLAEVLMESFRRYIASSENFKNR